jgi:amino acid transporter
MTERNAAPAPGDRSRGLEPNVVGLLGAATLGVVMLSPAMTLYGNFGPAYLAAGRSSALAFVWALVATLPTATSYALLSREHPSSGSAAAWVSAASRGLGPWGGWLARWAGWVVFLYYLDNFVIQPVTLGVFFNDLLRTLGAPVGFTTFLLGAGACCAWPAWIVFRGIRRSTHGALAFLLFETAVVVTLCLTVALVSRENGAKLGAEGFTLAASPTGMHGMFGALVFGMLSFCGYDVISTLGEETRMPSRLIPQATFLALVFFGALMIAGIWLLGYAVSPERLQRIAASGGMPITEIARAYWGRGAVLVPVTAITAALGLGIATSVGASRVLFSMARGGLAPSVFASLSARTRVPSAALGLVFSVGCLASVAVAAWVGPFRAFVFWGTTSTFFAIVTYLMVNGAALVLFRGKILGSVRGFLLYGVVPVAGISLDAYILVKAFFIELWEQGWAGQTVICFDLACAALAGALALRKLGAEEDPEAEPVV